MEISIYILLAVGLVIFTVTCCFAHLWIGTCALCRYRHLIPDTVATSFLPIPPIEDTEIGLQRKRALKGTSQTPASRTTAESRRLRSKRALPPPPSPPPSPSPSPPAPHSPPSTPPAISPADELVSDYSSVEDTRAVATTAHISSVPSEDKYTGSVSVDTAADFALRHQNPDTEGSGSTNVTRERDADTGIAGKSGEKLVRCGRALANYSSFL